MEIVNIENLIEDGFEIALCPLCDNEILEFERVVIGYGHGSKCLVHEFCLEQIEGFM